MKLNFFKTKKNRLPALSSLRPPVFDTEKFWFMGLCLALLIFIITAAVGFRLLYTQYFEEYKQSTTTDSDENSINLERLKSTISKRQNFLNGEMNLPRDPSL